MDSFRLGWISYFMRMPNQDQSKEWQAGWLAAKAYGETVYQQQYRQFNLANQPVHRDELKREPDGDVIFA